MHLFDKVKVVKSSKTKNQAYVVGMLRASVSYVRTVVRTSAYFPYVRVQYVRTVLNVCTMHMHVLCTCVPV